MSTFTVPFLPSSPAAIPVVPVSGVCPWSPAILPGMNSGIGVADPTNSIGILESADLITNATRMMFRRLTSSSSPLGTTLRARLLYLYDSNDSQPNPSPVIRVFGGYTDEKSQMVALRNLRGDASVAMSTKVLEDCRSFVEDPLDPQSYLEYRATIPHNTEHAWDCDGYDYFLIGVERAMQYEFDRWGCLLEIKFV